MTAWNSFIAVIAAISITAGLLAYSAKSILSFIKDSIEAMKEIKRIGANQSLSSSELTRSRMAILMRLVWALALELWSMVVFMWAMWVWWGILSGPDAGAPATKGDLAMGLTMAVVVVATWLQRPRWREIGRS